MTLPVMRAEQEVTPAEQEEHKLLASLAQAIVGSPRASLQELSKAVGISKATLYRFCRTRDQLVERLLEHSSQMISQAVAAANLNDTPALEAFKRLNSNCLAHRELTVFFVYYWRDASLNSVAIADWETQVDAFFLRGQQEGVFCIDIAAPGLTEIWVSLMLGLIDAELRGRIARASMHTLLERAFLNGVLA